MHYVTHNYSLIKSQYDTSVSAFRRPVALAYVVLSTLPCFAFLIASSEVKSCLTIHRKCCYPSWSWDSMYDVFRFSQMFISLLENQTDAFCINRDALNSQVVCSKEVTEKVLHAILTFSIQIIQGMCLTKQTNLVCRRKNTNISMFYCLSLSLLRYRLEMIWGWTRLLNCQCLWSFSPWSASI